MKSDVRPVTNGRARVPVIMQMDVLECGAASLTMILAYYNKWIPLEQVRLDCGVSRDGSNAVNIMKAAENYGLEANGYRCEPQQLIKSGLYPCIIHWNFNHFVVLCGFKGKYAYINDPAMGSIRVSMDEFDRSFTGIYLEFCPTEHFEPGGKRKSIIEFAKKRLTGLSFAVVFVVLTTLISLFFELLNPAFSRFFMDRLLTGENTELLTPFTVFLLAAGTVQVLMTALRSVYSLKISGKMDAIGSSTFFWKILRMPMEFFGQRMTGDIMQRQNANAVITDALVNTLVPLVLNMVMLLFYTLVMLRFSVMLTLIGVSVVLLNIYVSQMLSGEQVNITRVQQREAGKLASAALSGIRMIDNIKASGSESGFFQKWAGYQASVNAQNVKYAGLIQIFGTIPTFLTYLANASVIVIGVWLAMQGKFTVGMIMTFQGFMSSFMKPASGMITARQTMQEIRVDMERIEDVMDYPVDPYFKDEPLSEDFNYKKLSGEIELKNVTFGYSKIAPPLIKNFSMHLKPGSSVALVGASGCGKSTLSKLISGLYCPWSGEVLFDGRPIGEIERGVFTSSVAVVDQDIILFEDTIANNIKMWNDTIQDYEMILAAQNAQIYDDIMEREGGFDGWLSEDGRDLSAGERQKLEIARALAQKPTIIIMDEATSAVDAKTEFDLVNVMKSKGITCIVIAHRLSTIRDCDEIIVLDKGEIAERGTHDELLNSGGAYAELIACE